MKATNNGNGDGTSAIPLSRQSVADFTAVKLAPGWDLCELNEREHFVQFYESDDFFLDSLCAFIRSGLQAGNAAVVVATKSHLQGLETRLVECGVETSGLAQAGQFIALDADQTLAELMVDGVLSPSRFTGLIGGTIAQAAEGRSHVRVFGELVALLWADGKYDSALQVEQLWNDLGKTNPFTLFCAYPINGFAPQTLGQPLADVCATHSRVIPAESYATLRDSDEQLRAIIRLQQKAISLEAEIQERKKAEENLRLVKEELETQVVREQILRGEAEGANRMKDEFLATVSHELRTPLNAIIGWAHMLRRGRLDEQTVLRAIETIERNAKAQAQLVEDILDVSRVITGKLRLNMVPVDVASVINAAVDSVQLAAESKGIELKVILDPSARHILGDSNRLQQIVWNLLSNAIKFTPSGGRVDIRLERVKSNVQIKVSDTGEGIAAAFLPFVFDRFRQADPSSTRNHGGLGLGLAIVRHLVELHGGTVRAHSSGSGCGSTFTINLPMAVERKVPQQAGWPTDTYPPTENSISYLQVPSLKDVRVLMVDDDHDTLQILKVMLEEQLAQVQTAGSAAEALEILEWYKPAVLVFDLSMPDEDGCSLIRKIRSLDGNGGRVPAVALTAHVRVDDRARALSAGFNMFVPKPVQAEELITAIANLAEPQTTEVN